MLSAVEPFEWSGVSGSYHQWSSGSMMSSGELVGSRLRHRVETDGAQVSSGRLLSAHRGLTAGRRGTAGALLLEPQQKGKIYHRQRYDHRGRHVKKAAPPDVHNE